MNKTFRNFNITYNNPDDELFGGDYLESVFKHFGGQIKYICGQLESGENGTRHYQIFINTSTGVRPSAFKKFQPKWHIEGFAVNNGAHEYAMKVETRLEGPWEYGVKPVQRNNKMDWDE